MDSIDQLNDAAQIAAVSTFPLLAARINT